MKKILLSLLSLTFAVGLAVGIFGAQKITANGSNENTTNTTMFMPATRLEFYDLNSPQAICYKDGYLIITEYHKNEETGVETNKLIVYDPSKESYEVNISPTLMNVTCVAKYNDYLLLLIDSAIFTLPLDDISGTPFDTGVRVGKSFSVYDNVVVTNTSSGIQKYTISENNGNLTFSKFEEKAVTDVLSCLLTASGDFYYFVSGTGLIKREPDGGEEVIVYKSVPEIDIAPSHMAELGNFVYFTTPSGLYKVKKEKNSELIKVVAVSEDGGLGTLSSPAGITVKDGKLLVADTSLNCIQEIDPSVDKFTQFAVTTESTADYRLTNNASSMTMSENYLYCLDNATMRDGETEPIKRIVKISLDDRNKTYEKIDLTPVYENNPDVKDIKYAASDTHVLISDGKSVILYEQVKGSPITLKKVFEYKKRATAVYYLDNDFYLANYYIDVYNANAAFTQIYKIQLPSTENELTEITVSPITENEENLDFSKDVPGIPVDMTVDIFGNVYVATQNLETNPTEYRIHSYYNGKTISTNILTELPYGIEADFAGYVYALYSNSVIKKYDFTTTAITSTEYKVNAVGGFIVKDINLNYRNEKAYFLSDACIIVTTDENLDIQHLSRISADSVKPTELKTTQQFITVDKHAKLFKVTINDYITESGHTYFKTIEPISNPNIEKIYLVIAEIENDYYLISYSQKFTALVKKSSVQANSSTSLVPVENYEILGITVENANNEKQVVSNNVKYFSRPIFDNNYNIGSFEKGATVYKTLKVSFNGKTFILVSDENGSAIGYVPEGYLTNVILTSGTVKTETSTAVFENASQRKKNVLMIMIIAFTLTASALFLEFKILFKKPE